MILELADTIRVYENVPGLAKLISEEANIPSDLLSRLDTLKSQVDD